MLRKYLVLGIMMGALALTGCGAEEKKDNDKEEVKATQEAVKDNEKADEEKDTEKDNSEDKNSEEENPTEDLYYMYGEDKLNVCEWNVGGGTNCLVAFYAPTFGPNSDGSIKYVKGYYTRLTVTSMDKDGEKTLEEALTEGYARWADDAEIDNMNKGEIKDVTGEYVTVNGIECYKYKGTANRGIYVTGYMFETELKWMMIQMHVSAEEEDDILIGIKEADHNIDVVVKGIRIY